MGYSKQENIQKKTGGDTMGVDFKKSIKESPA